VNVGKISRVAASQPRLEPDSRNAGLQSAAKDVTAV